MEAKRHYFYLKFPKVPKSLSNSEKVWYDEVRELFYVSGDVPVHLQPYLLENYYYNMYK